MSRRSLLTGATALAAGAVGVAAARPVSATSAPGGAAGLTVVAQWRESARDLVYRLDSTALRYGATVRVLLPTGYDANPTKHYPTLYLLHGSADDASAWTDKSALRDITAGRDLIVVMPDGGQGGWYTNHAHVSVGRMDWETFHCDQLVAGADTTLRTIPTAAGRAVAGFSMGGYGAAMYAGRRPGLFSACTTFSGATDAYSMDWRNAMYTGPANDGDNLGAIYGTTPGSENAADLKAHDPSTYAAALVGRRVRLYAGNAAGYEAKLRNSTDIFRAALTAAGVADLGGGLVDGEHTYETAARALAQDLPGLLSYLAKPVTA